MKIPEDRRRDLTLLAGAVFICVGLWCFAGALLDPALRTTDRAFITIGGVWFVFLGMGCANG